MITTQDLYNIVGNKIADETGKAIIRNGFPTQIAEQMCNAIDGQEQLFGLTRIMKITQALLDQEFGDGGVS